MAQSVETTAVIMGANFSHLPKWPPAKVYCRATLEKFHKFEPCYLFVTNEFLASTLILSLTIVFLNCRCKNAFNISLRICAMYEAKNSKICNFWTFWPVIQLINHLFKIRQNCSKKCSSDFKKMV